MEPEVNNAIVNAGCLLFLTGHSVTPGINDVLDSLLYVQLAATKKHDKFSEFERWKETWLAAALRFGWMLKGSEYVCQPVSRTGGETVWGACTRELKTRVGEATLSESECLLRQRLQHDALGLLASQAVQPLAEGLMAPRTSMTLQLGFLDTSGTLALALLHLDSYQPVTSGFLFEPLEAGHMLGNLSVTVYSLQLQSLVYRQFRDAFDIALKDRRPTLVKPLYQSVGE
jgi:hypothetical protein